MLTYTYSPYKKDYSAFIKTDCTLRKTPRMNHLKFAILFYSLVFMGGVITAQNCDQLKSDILKEEARVSSLEDELKSVSGYDEKKALTIEIRELEGAIAVMKTEFGECAASAGLMTGDTYLLNKGLRQRANGSIIGAVGLVVAGAGAAAMATPLIAVGGILGLFGLVQEVSGSSKVLKATKE